MKIFYLFIFFAFIIFQNGALGQQIAGDILPKFIEESMVLNYMKWYAGKNGDQELVCIITEREDISISPAKIKVLKIYKRTNNLFKQIYDEELLDNPLGIFPTRDGGGKLVTIWVTGSAYHMYVFNYVNGKIVKDVDKGSKDLLYLIKSIKK